MLRKIKGCILRVIRPPIMTSINKQVIWKLYRVEGVVSARRAAILRLGIPKFPSAHPIYIVVLQPSSPLLQPPPPPLRFDQHSDIRARILGTYIGGSFCNGPLGDSAGVKCCLRAYQHSVKRVFVDTASLPAPPKRIYILGCARTADFTRAGGYESWRSLERVIPRYRGEVSMGLIWYMCIVRAR